MAKRTNSAKRECGVASLPIAEMSKLFELGYSLIPLGKGPDGKSPLVTFDGRRRLPLQTVIRMMQRAASTMYGVRLKRIVVVDCDTDNVQTLEFVAVNFGHSDFAVKTSQGRHLYFSGESTRPEKIVRDGVKIDLKAGRNAYVVGPGSIRPDNGANYTLLGNGLPSARSLPPFADRRDKYALHRSGLVPVGSRNNYLFKLAREHAEMHDSAESLFAEMKAIVEFECDLSLPFTDPDIWKPVEWVWNKRLANSLWGGKKSAVQIYMTDIDDLSPLPHGGNAVTLLAKLKHSFDRDEPKPFPIDRRAMAEANVINGWTEWTYRTALSTLLKAQKIIRVRKGGIHSGTKGQVASLFMFNSKSLSDQGERVSSYLREGSRPIGKAR